MSRLEMFTDSKSSRSLQLVCGQQLPELRTLWGAYLSELGQYDDGVETGMELQDGWWTKPDDLYGLTVQVNDRVVGFLLVMGERYAKAIGESSAYHLHEMYVDPDHRASGLAEWAFRSVLALYPGTWSLHTLRRNTRAIRFWRRVLSDPNYDLAERINEDDELSFHFRAPGPTAG